jgi:hypothetical protein
MITITKYTKRIILLSKTKRCTNTFARIPGSTKVQKKAIQTSPLPIRNKSNQKKGSNRREKEEKNEYNKDHSKRRRMI